MNLFRFYPPPLKVYPQTKNLAYSKYSINLFLKRFIYYFWLCWVFITACGLSLAMVCGLLIGKASPIE